MKKFLMIFLAVVLMSLPVTAELSARESIQIKGSDTLINLVQRLAEVYMTKHHVDIAVTGGQEAYGDNKTAFTKG